MRENARALPTASVMAWACVPFMVSCARVISNWMGGVGWIVVVRGTVIRNRGTVAMALKRNGDSTMAVAAAMPTMAAVDAVVTIAVAVASVTAAAMSFAMMLRHRGRGRHHCERGRSHPEHRTHVHSPVAVQRRRTVTNTLGDELEFDLNEPERWRFVNVDIAPRSLARDRSRDFLTPQPKGRL